MENTQNRIKNIVHGYKELFPEEYKVTVKAVEMQRRIQKDEFGSTQNSGNIQRALLEYPETLSTMLIQQLNEEELTYFKSKEGARWFARTFPMFSLATKI